MTKLQYIAAWRLMVREKCSLAQWNDTWREALNHARLGYFSADQAQFTKSVPIWRRPDGSTVAVTEVNWENHDKASADHAAKRAANRRAGPTGTR